MANRRDAFVCTMVFLVSASLISLPCSCASGDDQIEILNEINTNVSFHSTITFENRTTISDPPGTTLIQLKNGTAWDYLIPNATENILTSFEILNTSGHYYQSVFTWSNVQTPYVSCITNCLWRVDEHGFWVADVSKGALPVLQFVVSWKGPYPSI